MTDSGKPKHPIYREEVWGKSRSNAIKLELTQERNTKEADNRW